MFAGYGGLDLGLMQVFPEARPAWHMEIEPGPAHVLAHHYPTVPNLGDVTKVDWEHVEPVDIITAGYPCQPFSVAGHINSALCHSYAPRRQAVYLCEQYGQKPTEKNILYFIRRIKEATRQ